MNTAVEKASAAIMMVDRDLVITYVNQATQDLLGANAEIFEKAFPGLDMSRMVGTCIDVFHKNPAHQRRLLAQPLAAPHKAEITVSGLKFSLSISSIVDAAGEYVGNVLEWDNVTSRREDRGMLDAIDRSQAMIQFSLDGVIVNANENFLKTVGYSLSEIQGQHHGMFVDPAYRESADYQAFWAKLARGEYDAGEYKRIAKGGREIWIQASYNPILDASGRAMSVVKYATDITAEKMRNADFQGQIDAIDKSQAVIEFDLDGKVVQANGNFLATIGYSLEEIRGQHHSMFVPAELRDSLEYRAFWDKLRRGEYDAGKYQRVGKGGREIWLQASYNPILDLNGKPYKVVKYATDITEVAEQKKAAMRVKEVAEIVSSAATEMRATAESMAKTAQDASLQASSVTNAAQLASTNVQTVSAAGEELSASIAEIARQVAESTNITQQAVAETDRTSAAIQSLADAAQKIGNVVTLINNIAGQTKLLALNATIEAARAGDAGKGFAVVASEVKSLSDQTAKATHEISSEVSAMQAATATSVTAINGIAETIGKVAEIASAIASAVEEQSAATGEISANVVQAAESTREVTTNIEQLSEGVAQTGQAAGELLTASDELAGQAETLTAQVDTLLK
ncbi:MAG: PAS domain-containing methyl-accepting chemotaxis protein [Proteobacteria bacterium]|nr:PAS domain-containing methyl-accepting chemotaxis protein [Pseudomonadota bacterium]